MYFKMEHSLSKWNIINKLIVCSQMLHLLTNFFFIVGVNYKSYCKKKKQTSCDPSCINVHFVSFLWVFKYTLLFQSCLRVIVLLFRDFTYFRDTRHWNRIITLHLLKIEMEWHAIDRSFKRFKYRILDLIWNISLVWIFIRPRKVIM